MNELHLFAGAGGGILGGMLLGHTCVCAVELEKFPRNILLQRQRDGMLPWFPVWDDVTTFDGTPWRGIVDIVCGGFPCQDISVAGKGAGLSGERSGLWSEFARIIREVRPKFAFIENSPALVSRGLDVVLCDLAEMGYDAEWGIVGAHHTGASHKRDRVWVLAYDSMQERLQGENKPTSRNCKSGYKPPTEVFSLSRSYWENLLGSDQPLRANDGVAQWMDRISAIGNGQVPTVAALAWKILHDRIAGGN